MNDLLQLGLLSYAIGWLLYFVRRERAEWAFRAPMWLRFILGVPWRQEILAYCTAFQFLGLLLLAAYLSPEGVKSAVGVPWLVVGCIIVFVLPMVVATFQSNE